MDCLKCGRQTQTKNVFCPACLGDMSNYPVKQDTPVILPHPRNQERRLQPKPALKPEAVIAQLQLKLKRLWISVAVLAIFLTAVSGALVVMLYRQINPPDLGSNYSTFSSTEETGR